MDAISSKKKKEKMEEEIASNRERPVGEEVDTGESAKRTSKKRNRFAKTITAGYAHPDFFL